MSKGSKAGSGLKDLAAGVACRAEVVSMEITEWAQNNVNKNRFDMSSTFLYSGSRLTFQISSLGRNSTDLGRPFRKSLVIHTSIFIRTDHGDKFVTFATMTLGKLGGLAVSSSRRSSSSSSS